MRLLLSVCSHRTPGGEFPGGAAEASGCPGRRLEGEEGLYPPEPDCASLHDSEGLFHSEEQQLRPAASRTKNKKFPQTCFGMLEAGLLSEADFIPRILFTLKCSLKFSSGAPRFLSIRLPCAERSRNVKNIPACSPLLSWRKVGVFTPAGEAAGAPTLTADVHV